MWFTAFNVGRLGRLTLNGTLSLWPIPFADTAPRRLAVGSDNNIWFADQGSNSIDQFVAPDRFLAVTPAFSEVPADSTVDVTVQLVDAFDQPDPTYQGTIHFSSPDPQVVLPPDYTFTAADQGVHTFTGLYLGTRAAPKAITVTDTADGLIRGQAVVRVTGLAATHLRVTAPLMVMARMPFTVGVAALDQYENLDPNYAGTVSFTSTDGRAVLPGPYTFDPARDHGGHAFTGVMLMTMGTQTISVRDTDGLSGSTQVRVGPGDGPGSGSRKDGRGLALSSPAAAATSPPVKTAVPPPIPERGRERALPQEVDLVAATAPARELPAWEEGVRVLDRAFSDSGLLGLPVLFEDEAKPLVLRG